MLPKIKKHLKVSPYHHTGRRTKHHHTSYPLLVLVMIVTILAFRLVVNERQGVLATVTESGSISVAATVPGPAPSQPAVITVPTDTTRTTEPLIVVSGTCETNTLVKVFKNSIMAGMTACTASGTFSLQIALLPGRNDLTALNYDTLNQPGPASSTVTVYLLEASTSAGSDPSPGSNRLTTPPTTMLPAESVFYISTDYILRGLKEDVVFNWDLTVFGGDAPYLIEVDWGDGTNERQALANAGNLELSHTYARPGQYVIKVVGHDAQGRMTYLELVAIVDGEVNMVSVPATTASQDPPDYWMLSSIILYTALLVLLLWFWIVQHRHHGHHA